MNKGLILTSQGSISDQSYNLNVESLSVRLFFDLLNSKLFHNRFAELILSYNDHNSFLTSIFVFAHAFRILKSLHRIPLEIVRCEENQNFVLCKLLQSLKTELVQAEVDLQDVFFVLLGLKQIQHFLRVNQAANYKLKLVQIYFKPLHLLATKLGFDVVVHKIFKF